VPFVTVECDCCGGKAVIEKVFEDTRFKHCKTVEPIPEAVLSKYQDALANFKSGKHPKSDSGTVRWI
jgi:hypothetical protein